MTTCARNGYLVDATHAIPDDPTDLAVEMLPVVGCSRLSCSHCGARPVNLVGRRFTGNRDPGDMEAAFSDPMAATEPTEPEYRLYLCKCSSWTETESHPLFDADPDPMRDPTMPWACAGHPSIELPRDVDGEEIKDEAALRDVAARALHGWHPPRARDADKVRLAWLRRLYARLAGSAARTLVDAVVAHVGDPDPAVRGRVLIFMKNVSDTTLLAPLAVWLDGDRRLFAGIPDTISSIRGETLEDSLWRALAPLMTGSSRVTMLARRAARTPGRGSRALFDVLVERDAAWLAQNVDPVARAQLDTEPLLDALYNLDDDSVAARATKAHADKTPRARSLQEMLFAASLVPCPTCGSRVAALDLRGDGDAWVLGGPCKGCGTVRSFQFATEGHPRKGAHERLELGDGRPSTVIAPTQLTAELERLAPALHDDPRTLAPDEWYPHSEVADRAYTAAVELAKFLPPDGSEPFEAGIGHSRAWVEKERDRAIVRVDRIAADAPRIWLSRNKGILHVTEEIRGLLNQFGRILRPTAADLLAYLKPRSTSVAPRATDTFVELDSASVAAVRVWDDAVGAHAELHLKAVSEADVDEALLGASAPVDVRRSGKQVTSITIHYPRSGQNAP